MKKLISVVSICICMISCTQQHHTTNQNPSGTTTYKVTNVDTYTVINVIDSLVSLYPNLYVNDIQKEDFCNCMRKELDKRLKNDNTFIEEIPMKFSQMRKKNNGKYILKFECGKYTTNDKKLISTNSNTEINFAIFAEVNKDVAAMLEENAIYKIKGKYKSFVDGKLTLPSGRVFDYPSDCYKYSSDKYGTICLGGFLFNDLQIDKIH